MPTGNKKVLVVSMPFAGVAIPSIQLPLLQQYCTQRGVSVETKHWYLNAAAMYGLKLYTFLVYPPNDSYTAQLGFSRYVFPDHWKENKTALQTYYEHNIQKGDEQYTQHSFERYCIRTDTFYQWAVGAVDWGRYDVVGFTLNYGQLLPSLAVARYVKTHHPEIQIVLGGSRTMGELGKRILKAFSFVDCVATAEGEETLYLLATSDELSEIPGLVYQKNNTLFQTESGSGIDLNSLPFLNFDVFFDHLKQLEGQLQQYFSVMGRLPVEISRGCFWNRCTFCNMNVQYPRYREKTVDRIIDEITTYSKRYKMLRFQLIGNTLLRNNYRKLCQRLIDEQKDFSLFVETRAGRMTADDYRLLRQAGFSQIQTGIESFSTSYLQKMNKGVRVIDNIAALKHCQEQGITNNYNLLIGYPNEDERDFQQTQKNIALLQGFLDPPQLCHLRVMYGSPLYHHYTQFNIASLSAAHIDRLLFPQKILDQGISFVFDVKTKKNTTDNDWQTLVDDWKKTWKHRTMQTLQSHLDVDRYGLYYGDGGSFLTIYDKRDGANIRVYRLNQQERMMFLSCRDVISYDQLLKTHSDLPEFQIAAILRSFEQAGLVFRENDLYLSLPLRITTHNQPVLNKKSEEILNAPTH